MSDSKKRVHALKVILFLVTICFVASSAYADNTKQLIFVNKSGEVIFFVQHAGVTEEVSKRESDVVVWLITSGYNLYPVLPQNAVNDVHCMLELDDAEKISCYRVHEPASPKGGMTSGIATSFHFNVNLYAQYPELFYSVVQKDILRTRSNMRENLSREKK